MLIGVVRRCRVAMGRGLGLEVPVMFTLRAEWGD